MTRTNRRRFLACLAACVFLTGGTELPGRTVKVEVTVVYTGSELTTQEKQQVADSAASAASDAVAAAGKTVLTTQGASHDPE